MAENIDGVYAQIFYKNFKAIKYATIWSMKWHLVFYWVWPTVIEENGMINEFL